MKNIIIETVKNYSESYLSKGIEIVDKFDISDFKCAKIEIVGEINFEVLLFIDETSLNNICNELFGFYNSNLKEDLLKEIVNIIGGGIQTKLNRNLELSTPVLCSNYKIKKGLNFKNEKLQMAVSIILKQHKVD